MNYPISESDLKEVVNAILAYRKIEAIKLYRQFSGAGLKEAKDAVEELEKKLKVESPEKFQTEEVADKKQQSDNSKTATPGVQVGKGCFGMLAAVVLAAMILSLIAAFRH